MRGPRSSRRRYKTVQVSRRAMAWSPQQSQPQQTPAMAGASQPQGDAWAPAGAFGDDTPF